MTLDEILNNPVVVGVFFYSSDGRSHTYFDVQKLNKLQCAYMRVVLKRGKWVKPIGNCVTIQGTVYERFSVKIKTIDDALNFYNNTTN